ncbi:hypothetical protein SteCoe_23549 [Stentor coeruleus]|uniref:Uncharacterized protein n=1 Tax=Stentor coeruleus TaxID=5963 RepID=A0A1R2BJM2_9CILI|nr:hypothetical protein SteCoe_23549 [Stentor coeruleus]
MSQNQVINQLLEGVKLIGFKRATIIDNEVNYTINNSTENDSNQLSALPKNNYDIISYQGKGTENLYEKNLIMTIENEIKTKVSDIITYCDKRWCVFPLKISYDEVHKIIKLRASFCLDSRKNFLKPQYRIEIDKFIKKINPHVKLGYFAYCEPEDSYKYIINTHVEDQNHASKLASKLTDEAVLAYSSFGYGIYMLIEEVERLEASEKNVENEIEYMKFLHLILIDQCLKRQVFFEYKVTLFCRALIIKNPSTEKQKEINTLLSQNKFLYKVFALQNISITKNEIKLPVIRTELGKVNYKGREFVIKNKFKTLKKSIYKNCIFVEEFRRILEELLEVGLIFNQFTTKSTEDLMNFFVTYKTMIFFNYSTQTFLEFEIVPSTENKELYKQEIHKKIMQIYLSMCEKYEMITYYSQIF